MPDQENTERIALAQHAGRPDGRDRWERVLRVTCELAATVARDTAGQRYWETETPLHAFGAVYRRLLEHRQIADALGEHGYWRRRGAAARARGVPSGTGNRDALVLVPVHRGRALPAWGGRPYSGVICDHAATGGVREGPRPRSVFVPAGVTVSCSSLTAGGR
ncbi:hypothetical protein [Streptomyces rimosus]|uniref:hypothetical protein n=1 Tax=Streptomyces rimosus TaxID=1927 RepID=UPI000B105426|nr:hypothetical protein [Streptomyces rimosus]